jgi:iron-sulfur cluster repair protein YtfE (RIC family)
MSSFVTAPEARDRVLADHTRLRTLMGAVVASARDVLCDEKQRPRVREALAGLRTELERHVAYEEAVLAPILRDANAWGPVRAAHMAKDHDGQRAALVALAEDVGEEVRSVEALADEIEWFVQSFERDLCEEEATLLSADALGEVLLVVDQTDG